MDAFKPRTARCLSCYLQLSASSGQRTCLTRSLYSTIYVYGTVYMICMNIKSLSEWKDRNLLALQNTQANSTLVPGQLTLHYKCAVNVQLSSRHSKLVVMSPDQQEIQTR